MGELDAIPTAPRPVRRAAAFRHRWPLGVLGLVLVLVSVMAFSVIGTLGIDLLPLRDDALDADSARAPGRVTAVRDSGIDQPGGRAVRVEYRFVPGDGEPVDGASFAPHGSRFAVGEPCTIEYLAHAPEVSRVRGTRRNPLGRAWTVFVGFGFLPAVAVLLLWLRGAIQNRLLLSTGQLTLARILDSVEVGGIKPPQRRVRYEFRDGHGHTVRGSHWVGLHTPLGARLARDCETAPLVFDPARPAVSRLVHGSDFAT
jgi:hypothetical protein